MSFRSSLPLTVVPLVAIATGVVALVSFEYDRRVAERVTAAVPHAEVMDLLREQRAWHLVLVLLLIALAAGSSVWLAGRVSAPLRRLQEQTRIIAHGEPSDPIPEEGPAELRALAAHFNRMAAAVAAREAERAEHEEAVRRQAAELERRVADRTAQLAVANEELESFAYAVSHDLRAPLRKINGFVHALVQDCAAQLDDVGRDHLNRVRAASVQMVELIEDLLKLSQAARGELQPALVNLSALAERVVEALRAQEPTRAVTLTVQPGVTAIGDLNLLRVVLDNLLGNAWKYTAKMADARIDFGMEERDGEPVYFVRDNGAGFEMEYVGKLFQPFQRLHRPDEFEGHGIGLATVRRVIHRHGGWTWAEGAVGQGATVSFTLGSKR